MKIAATYENGMVFGHFGHTEIFKIYEVENGTITGSYLLDANGSGHGALAGLLNEQGVDVLICGGIGKGAQDALKAHGIELCAGAAGDADEAVRAYLAGTLKNTGANCDHHGEGHSCSDHACKSECGNSSNLGKKVRVHYKGTFNDGTQFDSSYDRGEPLVFVCGAGQMIRGFDAAVADMQIGEIRSVHLMPSEAYGEANPSAVFTIRIEQLPGAETLSAGQRVYLTNHYGQPVPVRVVAKDDTDITFDANHEMAGKELNFLIELLEVSEA